MLKVYPIALIVLFLTACAESKKVPYLQNIDSVMSAMEKTAQVSDPIFVTGDILAIIVTSPMPKAVAVFNNQNINSDEPGNTETQIPTYLVDSRGEINFPLVGKLRVAGLSRSAAEQLIVESIYPKYLTEPPSVSIRIHNFKISVLGEVKNPGIYEIPNDRVSILEAIAMAGDLTITGRRDNILLIRQYDGKETVSRFDLNDARLLTQPDYYLRQNDIVYVEPNKSKSRTSRVISPIASISVSIVSLLVTLANLIVNVVR